MIHINKPFSFFLTAGLLLSIFSCKSVHEPSKPEPAIVRENPAESRQEKVLADEASSPVREEMFSGSSQAKKLRSRMDTLSAGAAPAQPEGESLNRFNPNFNTESYDRIDENGFKNVVDDPLSTFSIDVDTASYSNMRRYINQGTLPPADAVRTEELINYFQYSYASPEQSSEKPFSVHTTVSKAPWDQKRALLRVGIKGKDINQDKQYRRNLVFLLDVSGSMNSPDKLPLLKKAFGMLSDQMTARDTVSIVVYAGASGLVLEPTEGNNRRKIIEALENLQAGGSTNGGEGIELAYRTAKKAFIKDGINRVILATDGDFNVGVTNRGDLTRLIEEKREEGIFLTILGFGSGNLKDSTMEELSNRGNGNYGYIDSVLEAKKMLVHEAGSTLVTIAKDVKIQIEFNPAEVASYRLIGYENRLLNKEDFNNDKIDAGEIGAGHTVTALYELVLTGQENPDARNVDPLKYQNNTLNPGAKKAGEFATVKIRHKDPDSSASKLTVYTLPATVTEWKQTDDDFRFASSIAVFAMTLRNSPHKGNSSYQMAYDIARNALGKDPFGYRAEYLSLIKKAEGLTSVR